MNIQERITLSNLMIGVAIYKNFRISLDKRRAIFKNIRPQPRRPFSPGISPQIATAFPAYLSYNIPWKKEAGRRDGHLHRQRVCSERSDGLSAPPLRGPAGGASPAAGALRTGGPGRGRLRGGGVSAGAGLFGPDAGEAGGGSAAGAHRLRRGGKALAAFAAVLRRLLRHGGLRAGPRASGGGRGPGGERRVLHQRGRQSAGRRRDGGLRRPLRGLPGGGGPRGEGRAAAGPGLHRRADGGADGPVGYGQRPPVPGREGGAGDGSGSFGRRPASGGGPNFPPPGARGPGGTAGAPAFRRPVPAAQADAIPRGGDERGAASGHPNGLDGNQRNPVSGADGGPGAHSAGHGLRGAVGRPGGKGRTIWKCFKNAGIWQTGCWAGCGSGCQSG